MKVKNNSRANLPAMLLIFLLLMIWQCAAMGINAAYILPTPWQVLVRLWELRDPLFGAHLPATMAVVGIGLGLSIVREIIQAHQETIDVISTEGAGTEFIFRLPKAL